MLRRSTFLAILAAVLLFAAAPSGAHGKGAKVKGNITRIDCTRLLVQHKADPSVRYRPGRDVYGRKVTPAEGPGRPGSRIVLPETYTIDLELDLRQFLGVATIPGLNPNLRPGRITVTGDRVYFNGQPLDNPRRYQVIEACRKRLRRR